MESSYSHGILPYSNYFGYPLLTAALPPKEDASGVEASRKKRSAEPEAEPAPEAEADPQLLLSTGLHYPAAVTSYASPVTYNLPTTYSYTHGLYPYTGLYGGLGYPFGYPYLALAKPAEEDTAVDAARKKRSAEPEAEAEPEPEADPQVLLSSLPYTFPLTHHVPLTYSTLTHSAFTYPLGYTFHGHGK